ncbi:hypothetical protein O1611_g638 [Lasiodiplodia mahajangana]|uniref:Uncharacterized protein n=1 Tax=Lasiodiplodia mahajangana TaxID=1108764 RepID=A0ACC2JZY1_9PEZI|nr:hypothetical protein O1611_g638 [Lasiodiplodia mahajangana]
MERRPAPGRIEHQAVSYGIYMIPTLQIAFENANLQTKRLYRLNMADPLSLSLALAPLVIEAFKGFRAAKSKLRIFSHYSRELKRIQRGFEIQRVIFESECELLFLQITKDHSQVEALLRARELDANARSIMRGACTYLGRKQEAFSGVFEGIQASLQDLGNELESFQPFESERKDNETLRATVRRLRDRLKITINVTNYDNALKRLREYNSDLKSIIKYARKWKGDLPRVQVQDVAGSPEPLRSGWWEFGRVRPAALAFYKATVGNWICEERKHQRHVIKLFANPEIREDVRMNFLLLGEWELSGTTVSKRIDSISLQVRSAIVERPRQLALGNREMPQASINSRAVKRRRISRDDETLVNSRSSYPHSPSNSDGHSLLPHRRANEGSNTQEDGYTSERSCIMKMQQLRDPACLGYVDIETQNLFRHSFYPWSGVCRGSTTAVKSVTTAKSLADLFDGPVYENFDILDQLLMAKTVVATILQFHSTPWLGSWWTMRDIHYLNNRIEMASVLSTLHFGIVMGRRHKRVCEQADVLPPAQQDAESGGPSQHVRNSVLHNLGVGLLQIDRWTHLDPNAVDEIHKLALQRSRLGPKYRDLVQKCLHCDFGVGDDLSTPKLQDAIVNQVMAELESMISGLEIDDDDEEA